MSRYTRHNDNSDGNTGLWGGFVVLVIGLIFLLRKLEVHLPEWVFSWPMLLIFIGFVMGVKNRFQGGGWFILTFIGTVFLVNDIMPFQWQLQRFFWPVVLIVIGVIMIGRAAGRNKRYEEIMGDGGSRNYQHTAAGSMEHTSASPEDYLRSTTMFGSTNKVVLSKNFLGGNISTMFGGTELNFMQADINGEAVLEINTIFGGIELVVPANWDVKMDVSTMFGGIEDKRTAIPGTGAKVLVIKGSCTFGGVDLRNY